jgi:hypothetical protein
MRPGEHPLTPEAAASAMATLRQFRFYPDAPDAAGYDALVLALIGDMCPSIESAAWLVKRAFRLWNGEWKGPAELRAILCTKYSPADGETVYSQLPEFKFSGIPPEKPLPQPDLVRLPPGRSFTADAKIDAEAEQAFAVIGARMPALPQLSSAERRRAAEFDKVLEEVVTPTREREDPPLPIKRRRRRVGFVRVGADGNLELAQDEWRAPLPEGAYRRITQADVDRVVAARRKAEE